MTPEERFWAKVDKAGECWNWTASTNNRGYGKILWRGRLALAHRVSFELHTAAIPPRESLVLHSCDNRRCVRPDHLSLGTQLQNMRECRDRGRSARGSRNGQARLSVGSAAEIHSRLAAGEPHHSIAARFGVARQTITNISTGRSWSP